MKLKLKQASFCVVLVLLVVGFLELTFSLLALVSPRIDNLLESPWTFDTIPPDLPDERLGHRLNPAYPGHDPNGFRNPEVPAEAHIVTLGDSQTYGVGVESEEAWPKRLESMIKRTVYNMAVGGYGPTHSLVLWEEALALRPKIVLVAFYAGNDLFDSFDHVYKHGQFPELKSSDRQLQERMRAAEESEPIAERVSRMLQMRTIDTAIDSRRRFLAEYSRLYRLARRTKYEFLRWVNRPNNEQEKWEIAKAFAQANPAYCQIFNDGQFKTIFTSEYRLSALDLGDPRIAEGLQITLRAMLRMDEIAAASNIRFIVVLIPTKESVFRKLWRSPSMSYRNLTENEEHLSKSMRTFLEQNGIEYLDSLPVLQEQLAIGIQPYSVSHDGHPNEHGHRAIAKFVAARVESMNTREPQAKQPDTIKERLPDMSF